MELRRASSLPEISVLGDRLRLERMIVNLLENALRYAPRGSAVELTATAQEDLARITVADRGPGVPEVARASLFEKLQQGPHKTGRLGLGLYFCRITAQACGGRVGFEEREGGGALFWIELPIVR